MTVLPSSVQAFYSESYFRGSNGYARAIDGDTVRAVNAATRTTHEIRFSQLPRGFDVRAMSYAFDEMQSAVDPALALRFAIARSLYQPQQTMARWQEMANAFDAAVASLSIPVESSFPTVPVVVGGLLLLGAAWFAWK